jgi:AcrR family transcriptional regulator
MTEAAVLPGLRERKKAQLRQAILDAARRLFEARGYDQVTVAEIADAADVSVKTLFSYFRSKEDLALRDTRLIDSIVHAIRTRPRLLTPAQAVAERLIEWLAQGGGDSLAAAQREDGDNPAIQSRLLRLWLEYEDLIAAELSREAGRAAPTADSRMYAAQITLLIRACAWPQVAELAQIGQVRTSLEKWLKMTAWRLE